jgi:hypothetical protein
MKTIHRVKIAGIDARNFGALSIAVFFLPLFILDFQSCTRGTETVDGIIINLEEGLGNVRLANLSEFADGVLYIPLETMPGMELDYITRLSSNDSLFFINDGKTCVLFSSTGKILYKIGSKGRGPGEYNIAGQNDITSSNTLLVRDLYKLIEFDIQGEFLRSSDIFRHPTGSGAFGRWITLSDSLLFVNVRNDSGEEMNKAQVMNMNGRIIKNYPNYIYFKQDKVGTFTFSGISSLDRYSDKVSLKEAVNDTLFYLDNDLTLRPGYVFHMGKYKTGYMDLLDGTAYKREYAYTQDVFETEKFFFLTLRGLCNAFRRATPIVEVVTGLGGQVIDLEIWYYKGALLMVVDKTTGKSFLNDISRSDEFIFKSGFINDLDGGPRFLPRFRLDDSRFVMPVEALELKQYIKSDEFRESSSLYPEKKKALEELANSLSESDNPVLMVVTMK